MRRLTLTVSSSPGMRDNDLRDNDCDLVYYRSIIIRRMVNSQLQKNGLMREISAVLAAVTLLAIPLIATAQIGDSEAKNIGFNITKVAPGFKGGIKQSGGLINTVLNIVNALLVLAAIAAVVYIILAGVRYFSSQGDEDAVEQAKNSLIYGVIGIIVIILAIVIITFFTSQVSSTAGLTH